MKFQGKYFFLSNFFSVVVELDGMNFSSVEHAYQAAKTHDVKTRRKIQALYSPGAAKKFGAAFPLREDWEDVKLDVMLSLVRKKFQHKILRASLVAVEGEIVEDNTWGDTFWGRCGGVGENHLGRILMEVREKCLK